MSSGRPDGRRSSRTVSGRRGRLESGRREKSTVSSRRKDAAPTERRVLVDTSALISAIVFGGSTRSVLLLGTTGQVRLVTSRYLLAELARVLVSRFGFSTEAVQDLVGELEIIALVVNPTDVPRVCRDRGDDFVLAAAREGRARWLVTGDDDLLALGSYGACAIVKPRTFLDEVV
jgi:putative PIN family toxin of toxin-antitoxin system